MSNKTDYELNMKYQLYDMTSTQIQIRAKIIAIQNFWCKLHADGNYVTIKCTCKYIHLYLILKLKCQKLH